MDFTFRQLQYFIAVAEEGTITAAADRLHISASALSGAITELERILDVQLCVRRKARGLTLTPSGIEALEQARAVMRAAAEIEFTSRAPQGELAGPISIGSYLTLSPTVMPKIVQGFGDLHSRVHLNMVEGSREELIRRLGTGDLDVAVVFDTEVPESLNRVPLYQLPAHILLAANHRLAGETAIDLADLREEPLILYDVPPSSELTLGIFTARGLRPIVRHRSQSYEAVRGLVARGLGYSVLVQRPVVQRSYEGLPLVVKEMKPPAALFSVVMIWPAGVVLSPRVEELVEFARSLDWKVDGQSTELSAVVED